MPAICRSASGLPMAQTIWYVPTGLDPWNQLLGTMPGHYNRAWWISSATSAADRSRLAEPPA